MALSEAALHVHFLRHGEVASHRGDVPLTPRGRQQIAARGQDLSAVLVPNEIVTLLHAPTQRTHETALALYKAIADALAGNGRNVQLVPPVMHNAMRNPDIYVAGERVEMVSSVQALAEQLPVGRMSNEDLEQLPFWRNFWSHADRIGYWVNHPNPPGEDARAVARRLLTFAVSLLDLPRTQIRRYICVTHSPLMRAFLLRYVYASDPGEPEYGESVDLHFTPDGELIVQYLDINRTLHVPVLL
jgi:broad specificity phosphatase PhoE